MHERELYYNVKKQDWVLFDGRLGQNREIEDIAVVVLMECDGHYFIWCKSHACFEKVVDTDGVKWQTASCVMHGVPACFSYGNKQSKVPCIFTGFSYYENRSVVKIPVRWRLHAHAEDPVLFVGVDICEIFLARSNDLPAFCRPHIRAFSYGTVTYNLENEEITYFSKHITYPRTVMGNTIDMLKDLVGRTYGLRPGKINHPLKGKTYIQALMFRPYDLNCYFLDHYVDMSLVPKVCKNAYHIVCKQLGVEPPKGLKKLYSYNPYVVPMYRVLLELGFTDYNLMRPFFSGARIGDIDFERCSTANFPFWSDDEEEANEKFDPYALGAHRVEDSIAQEEIDAILRGCLDGPWRKDYSLWEKVKFLVGWMIESKGEKWAAKKLYKYSEGKQLRWQYDVHAMLYQYFDDLSDDIKKEFLAKGCTIALHDRLVYEINHLDYMRQELKYPDYLEDLECEINGFRFELLRHTEELAEIGQEMHNCVASYIQRVKERECTVLVVRREQHNLACIEIDHKGCNIKQALGISNKKLEGDLLLAVCLWADRMHLRDESGELDRAGLALQDGKQVEYKQLAGKKSYFLYTIKELVSLSKEERGCGFYRALATKVVTREFQLDHIVGMPVLNEIPDRNERVYIHRVCSDLDSIIEDALFGCVEAQIVMCELYQQYLPKNPARRQFWYRKIRDVLYYFPPLDRNVWDEAGW